MCYDLVAGVRFSLIPLASIAALCVVLFAGVYGYTSFFHIDVSDLSSSDVFGLVLAGATRFEWRPGMLIRLPLGWMALMGFVLYASLTYPAFDMRASGGRSLLAVGSRRTWLLSKMLWVCLVTIAAVAAIVAVSLVISCALSMPLGLEIHDAALRLCMVSADSIALRESCIVPFLLAVMAALVAIAELQLMISLFIHPVLAFGACMAYLVIGYFIQSPLLLGNGAMLSRWGGAVSTGVAPHEIMAVAAMVCAVVCIGGMWAIGKIDIYEKGAE